MVPPSAPFRVLSWQDLRSLGPTVCFSDVLCLAPSRWAGEEGVFVHPDDVHLLRAAAYRHFNVTAPPRRLTVARVLLAYPEALEIGGLDALREYFTRNGVAYCVGFHVELVVF